MTLEEQLREVREYAARKRGQIRELKFFQGRLRAGAYPTVKEVLEAVDGWLDVEFDDLEALLEKCGDLEDRMMERDGSLRA